MAFHNTIISNCTSSTTVITDIPRQRPATPPIPDNKFTAWITTKRVSVPVKICWRSRINSLVAIFVKYLSIQFLWHATRSLQSNEANEWENLEPLILTRLNFNPSMDKYNMPGKMWGEIIYPFLNFNGLHCLGMDKFFHLALYNGCN